MNDHQIERAFINDVLLRYPECALMQGGDGARVESVGNSVVDEVDVWQSDRTVFTCGHWYGQIAVGDDRRWAVWGVNDNDESDVESDDRGRWVRLYDTEAEAKSSFIEKLINICDHYDRPAPEEWPDDEQERDWQTKRLAEYIKTYTPYWRALTGFPDDVVAYCIYARDDARAMWEHTGGNATPDQVESHRMLAGLTMGSFGLL